MSSTNRPHPPLVIAHRATMGHAPENTLAGIRAGLAMGVDGIEVDVRLSADGVPVLMHDGDLDRTTNGHGPLAAHTLAALRKLDAGSGERVPTLREALELSGRDADLVIEVKAGQGDDLLQVCRRVVEDVQARDLSHHVWLWSFDAATLGALVRVAGSMRIAHLCMEPSELVIKRTLELKLAGISMRGGSASAETLERLESAGLATFVWTVNTAAELERLVALPLTGIVSDYPERVRAAIETVQSRTGSRP